MSDLTVLGAGSAGYAAALRASQLGLEVTLIDPGPVGGTCLHVGCIPTKAWLESAKVRRTVQGAAAFGIAPGEGEVDVVGIRAHADGVIHQLHSGLQGLISASGVRHIQAAGRLVGGTTVEVDGDRLESGALLIATGAEPITLGLPIDGTRILVSDQALRLERLPQRAIVLGGGVVGIEFASAWADLGVEVTLVEATDRLLPAEDPAMTRVLTRALAGRGVDIRLNTTLDDARATDAGVTTSLGDESLEADVLLVAVGRRARTAGIGIEEAGIPLTGSTIDTTDELLTNLPHVYAGGDVVAGPQLAHRGFAHGMYVAEHVAWRKGLIHGVDALPPDVNIPRVTYSSPQVASVGLKESEAGEGAESVTYPLAGNGRALISRPVGERETGLVKVVRSARGPIVGVHAVGEDVAELVTTGTLNVGWAAEPEDVTSVVHPHPSISEGLSEAILALGGRPLHMRR